MAGYTRQSVADIVSGQVIKAEPINNELNQLLAAFAASSGHKHDGSTGQGGYIPLIGDVDALNKVVVDTTNNRVGFFSEVGGVATEQIRIQDGALVPVTDNDIDLGSASAEFKDLYIDGVGYIDTLAVHENATITGNLTVNGNTTLGSDATDTVTVNADVSSDLIPSADATYDLGASGSEWNDAYITGTANIDSLVADTADINAGTIDNTVIGNTTAASGEFTTLGSSGNLTVGGTAGITGNTTLAGTLGVTGVAGFGDTVTVPDLSATGTATLATVDINAGNIDGTVIGASTAAAGSFTTVSTSGQGTFATVDVNGGTIDGTTIGGTTPGLITGTTVTANTCFVGDVTGNVAGNVTGNVTGNITGDVTGDVTGNLTGNVTGNVTGDATGCHTGNFDGTIGATTPAAVTGTTITANTCFVGYVTGDVLGNVTGNVTGNVSGNLTGNVTGNVTGDLTGDVTGGVTGDVAGNLTGNVTGDVTGDLTGNVTGNVTGDVTGDVTSTGTSTFTTLQLTGNMDANSNKITNLAEPVSDSDAATKLYVDNAVEGLDVKGSVKVATTANITLSGTQTIDDISVVADDRVLVKDQSTASENGVYVVAAGAWSRADDADTFDKHVGAFFFVEEGTTSADNGFVGTADSGGTLDTTDITFVQFSGAGQITAGTGLTKSGNTINVVTANSGRIVTNADNIDLATTGVSAGTYKSVTTDIYGRITGGTNPTTLSGYGITDAYTITCSDTLLDAKLDVAGDTMTGNLSMGSNKVTSTATPTTDDDLTRKGYVDTQDDLKVNLTGGTLSGDLALGGNKVTSTATPITDDTLTRKGYVDTQRDTRLACTGGTLSGNVETTCPIISCYTPANSCDLTNKCYVDGILQSATAACTSAACALASQTAAATSETNAGNSASAALTSANNAATSYDDFDDRYLGNKASNPTVDNDGDSLLTGALYWNTTDNALKVYTGSAWDDAAFTLGDSLTAVSEDATPSLGGNLNAGSNCIYGTGTVCVSNLYGTLTGDVTGNVTGTVSDISNHDTDDLAEGTNQYYTTARVDSHLAGGTGVTYSSGNISIGQSVGTSDNVCFGSVCVSANPTAACQLATKEYVDTIAAAGIHYHTPVRVESPDSAGSLAATYDNGASGVGATLTNNSTQAALVIDGVTVNTNDRVLIYSQTNGYENGIYTVTNTGSASTNWVLTRATDADSYGASDQDALGEGDAFFVKEGDTGAGELYVMNTSGVITFGTTNISFTVVAETAVYEAGSGLTLDGTTFNIGAGTGITVNASNIAIGQAVGTGDTVNFARVCAPVTGNVTGNASTATTWATGRSISLTGAVTGSVTGVNGSGNVSIATTATSDPTLCICGDATGSATFTNLGNANLSLTIADDSHNHTVANVDGLATCLSGKATTGCVNTLATCDGNIVTCLGTKATNTCAGTIVTCLGGLTTCTGTITTCLGTKATTTCAAALCSCLAGKATTGCVNTLATCDGTIVTCLGTKATTSCAGTIVTCLGTKAPTNGSLANNFSANCFCADICAKSPIVCGSTCVIGAVVCGPTTRGTTACFTDFNSTSDCRCKENITEVEDAYTRVGQIRGVNYNWKDSGKYTLGVIAQEVEEAFPELVTTDEDGFKAVNYNGLVGVLVETVKCLQGKVEELENGSKG